MLRLHLAPHKFLIIILSCLFSILFPLNLSLALPIAVDQIESGTSLKNSAYFFVDPARQMDINAASAPALQTEYTLFQEAIPLKAEGNLWLRFSLIRSNTNSITASGEPVLYLGNNAPDAQVFLAKNISNAGAVREWQKYDLKDGASLNLEDPKLLPLTVFVLLENVPSPWFNPLISPPASQDSAAQMNVFYIILQISIAALLCLNFLRALKSQEYWRFWISALTACTFITIYFNAGDSLSPIIYFTNLPILLAPGIAVMLMPQVGRLLLQSTDKSALDIFLTTLSVPGIIIALLPLIPNFLWTKHLLPLAPLALIPTLIVAFVCIFKKQGSAKPFFILCLLPCVAAVISLMALFNPINWPVIGSDLTAVAYTLTALIALFASARKGKEHEQSNSFSEDLFGEFDSAIAIGRHKAKNDDLLIMLASDVKTDTKNTTNDKTVDLKLATIFQDLAPVNEIASTGPDLENLQNLQDWDTTLPNLQSEQATKAFSALHEKQEIKQIITIEEPIAEYNILSSKAEAALAQQEQDWLLKATPMGTEASNTKLALLRLESALRTPYESLLHNLQDLNKLIENDEGSVAQNIAGAIQSLGFLLDNLDEVGQGKTNSIQAKASPFNLVGLVHNVFKQNALTAEEKNIAFSWFSSPALAPFYYGEEENLRTALSQLLQAALENAESGALQISVRAIERHEETETVVFTILNATSQANSNTKGALWINRIWEIANQSEGGFSVDFTHGKGIELSFSLKLKIMDMQTADPKLDTSDAQKIASQKEVIELIEAEHNAENTTVLEEEVNKESLQPLLPMQGATVISIFEEDFDNFDDKNSTTPQTKPRLSSVTDKYENVKVILPPLSIDLTFDSLNEHNKYNEDDDVKNSESSNDVEALKKFTPPSFAREQVVIADMAASGRRILVRRFENSGYQLIETKNARATITASDSKTVGLIVIDADMPEIEIKEALEKIKHRQQILSLPAIPSICVVSHHSQISRLLNLEVTACFVKSDSKEDFLNLAYELSPLSPKTLATLELNSKSDAKVKPKQDSQSVKNALEFSTRLETDHWLKNRTLPEDSKLILNDRRSKEVARPVETVEIVEMVEMVEAVEAAEATKTEIVKNDLQQSDNLAPDKSISMLDLIVDALDAENLSAQAQSSDAQAENKQDNSTIKNKNANNLTLLPNISGGVEEYIYTDMLPFIPGLLVVLEDGLFDLKQGIAKEDPLSVEEASERLAAQGRTYGLQTLERMANCVMQAAAAGDQEAIGDFSNELERLAQKYKQNLKLAHEEYIKNGGTDPDDLLI